MYKLFLKSFLIISAFLFTLNCFGQDKFLAIERPGHIKRIKFSIGEEIRIRIKGDDFYTTQKIEELYDSTVVLNGKYIALGDIESFKYKSENILVRNLAKKFPVASVLLLGISALNSTSRIDDEDNAVITRGSWIAASSLMFVGLIGNVMMRKTIKIKRNKRLMIIDTRISVEN